ncbi:MAG: transcription antitermination factor NusB [Pyrinomonadaceae bacterium]|nr:transcription antitermination factor NusB [Pyrinomonadaceae bacterium]MCX7639112.1 transcription antitermination factor NusB [Pyrinomonadaceae bacterium]MDW8303667.1 transcription antitermination factor NusB [Acidobacteriota bacterium]
MGTRRKARECSLQIMFAADFRNFMDIENLIRDYWKEFGFDEVSKGTSLLVKNFFEEIDGLEILLKDIKGVVKKITHYRENSKVGEEYEKLIWTGKLVSENYKKMVEEAIEGKSSWEDKIRDVEAILEKYEKDVKGFFTDVEYWMQKDEKLYLMMDFEEIREVEEKFSQVLVRLVENVGNFVEVGREVEKVREFADRLVTGTVAMLKVIDEMITLKAEHWRLSRMAIVDRNVLRLAVYEMMKEETPRTVVISEALETARRFSGYEAAQFVNGLLDAIKTDLENEDQNKIDENSQQLHQAS